MLLPEPVLCLLAAETWLLLYPAVAATVAAAQEKKNKSYALQPKKSLRFSAIMKGVSEGGTTPVSF